MKKILLLGALLFVTACASHPAPKPEDAAAATSAANAAPAMPSPEEIAKLAAPSSGHEKLAGLVGKWKYTASMWMSPEGKPEIMHGVGTNRWILGKRFIMQEARGTDKKHPFEGMGITGFDNVRGEYNSIWIDSMNTGMMTATGSFDAALNGLRETGSFSCPMSGAKEIPFRAEWVMPTKNNYSYAMYTKTPDGKEFKGFEIAYQRIK